MKSQKGFTLAELMVSMLMFGIVGMGLTGFTSSAIRELSNQSRLSFATLELKNAISMLSSEIRMSSAISPYIPGTNTTLTNCYGAVEVTSTTLRFLVSEDDAAATTTAGLRPYYVGYRFNSATGQLTRGEILGSTVTACTVPSGDPNSTTNGKTLAEKVVQIDADNNGSLDPVFSLTNNVLTVNLGVQVSTPGNKTITQKFSTRVFLRTNY